VASVGGCLFSEVASIMAATVIMTMIMLYEMIMLLIIASRNARKAKKMERLLFLCLWPVVVAGRSQGVVAAREGIGCPSMLPMSLVPDVNASYGTKMIARSTPYAVKPHASARPAGFGALTARRAAQSNGLVP
jgi:hypothetical protein